MSGVSAAFAVKLFKSWINEKDINSVAASLRKVGMDNRLMVRLLPPPHCQSPACVGQSAPSPQELFPANKRSCEHFSKYFTDAGLKELSDFARNQQSIGARKELQKELQEQMARGDPQKEVGGRVEVAQESVQFVSLSHSFLPIAHYPTLEFHNKSFTCLETGTQCVPEG